MSVVKQLYILGLLSAFVLGGCSTTTVKSTAVTPLESPVEEIAEKELLDVGITLFDAGLDDLKEDDITVYPEVREAEARYFPVVLMKTMQASATWGAVRVVPKDIATVDLRVHGKILHSDGEMLKLLIRVHDATGRQWFEKKYSKETSKFSYRKGSGPSSDPFQDLYNRVANDIAAYRNELDGKELRKVRTVAELKFAQDFSPQAFGGYLKKNKKGIYQVKRLPAEQDPMLQRVERIRERDFLFVDTLQEYYGSFSRDIALPYYDWRRESYNEVVALEELRRETRARTIGGIAAILAGIFVAGTESGVAHQAGVVSVLGGGLLVKSAIEKHQEAEMHAEAMKELGSSLGAEITPQVIDLDDQTITLSGTVQEQYQQWRAILKDIYAEETGDIPAADSGS